MRDDYQLKPRFGFKLSFDPDAAEIAALRWYWQDVEIDPLSTPDSMWVLYSNFHVVAGIRLNWKRDSLMGLWQETTSNPLDADIDNLEQHSALPDNLWFRNLGPKVLLSLPLSPRPLSLHILASAARIANLCEVLRQKTQPQCCLGFLEIHPQQDHI